MTVEQTSQLIQLILNSVLMVTACVVVLGALLMRHAAVHNRLRSMNQEYFHLLSEAVVLRGDRLFQIKQQLLQFRQRYSAIYFSLVVIYIALLIFVVSTLLIALRTLVNWQELITLSLGVFVVGIGVFLLGIGLSLVDFLLSRRSFLEEMNWVLGLGDRSGMLSKSHAQRPSRRRPRHRVSPDGHLQRQVGSG